MQGKKHGAATGRHTSEPAGERPDAANASAASTQSTSPKATTRQSLPLFTPACTAAVAKQDLPPAATVPNILATQTHSLSPLKRPLDDISRQDQQPSHQPSAINQYNPISHAPRPPGQRAQHAAAPVQSHPSQQLISQWPLISSQVPAEGAAGRLSDRFVPGVSASAPWGVMRPAAGLAAAAAPQATGIFSSSMKTPATDVSASVQQEQETSRQQTALNIDRALMNHLQLVCLSV
jgi:hypothetical protein